jgi:hypothetical protein
VKEAEERLDEDEAGDDEEAYMQGRQRVHTDLERTFRLPSPFHEFPIVRGQTRGLNFFQKWLGTGGIQNVGEFKGYIQIYKESTGKPKETSLFAPAIKDPRKDLRPSACVVRVYVLRALNLIPSDKGVTDPYLVLKLGDKKISDRDRHLRNQADKFCDLFRSFEFDCSLPGTSLLTITVRDWDLIFPDSDIGSTTIDLENRFYSAEWKQLMAENNNKPPVEIRRLTLPTSGRQQGQLECWVEILTPQMAVAPLLDISKPPVEPFVLRLVAWSARNLTIKDEMSEQNDPFVRVTFTAVGNSGELHEVTQESDTHWRAKDQVGNFNYRFLFDLELPYRKMQRLTIQVFDKDVIGANDLIGETVLPIKQMLKRALTRYRKTRARKAPWPNTDTIVHFPAERQLGGRRMKRGVGKKWIKLWSIDPLTKRPKEEGELEIEFEILHKDVLEVSPSGPGRSEPNQNPALPEPDRFHFSFLHPFASLKECLGPAMFRKFFIAIFCSILLSVLVFVAPKAIEILVLTLHH